MANNIAWSFCTYQNNTKQIENYYRTTNPYSWRLQEKHQILFTDIVGEWYLNNMHNNKLRTKNQRFSSTYQEEKDKTKVQLTVACYHCKYWIFQINRKNWNMWKPPFCMSYNNIFLKDGLQDNHWLGHLVIKSIDAVEFRKEEQQEKSTTTKANTLKWRLLGKVC